MSIYVKTMDEFVFCLLSSDPSKVNIVTLKMGLEQKAFAKTAILKAFSWNKY